MDIQLPTEEEYQAAIRRDHARRRVKAAQHIEGAWGQDLITEEDRQVLQEDSLIQVRRDQRHLSEAARIRTAQRYLACGR
jgi:hypothetical protein